MITNTAAMTKFHEKYDAWRECNASSPYNWKHAEWANDFYYPCNSNVRTLMLIREPWSRFVSLMLKGPNDKVARLIKSTENHLLHNKPSTITKAEWMANGGGSLQRRRLDNQYIRFLLGSDYTISTPFGGVEEEDCNKAMELLQYIDTFLDLHLLLSYPDVHLYDVLNYFIRDTGYTAFEPMQKEVHNKHKYNENRIDYMKDAFIELNKWDYKVYEYGKEEALRVIKLISETEK